jgi:polysaccharide export outer membrane protein
MNNKYYKALYLAIGSACALCGCTLQPITPVAPHEVVVTGTVTEKGVEKSVVGDTASAYWVKALDPIILKFSGAPELNTLEVIVNERGQINLPYLEPVTVENMTAAEVEKKIEQLYVAGEIYRNLSVNVTLTAKNYFVQGEVNTPGKFPLSSGTTLLQALAASSGANAYASDMVTITRKGKIYKYNMRDLEKYPSNDISIEAGDVIKVLQSWF